MDSKKLIRLIINGIFSGCYRKCRNKSQIVRCLIYWEFSMITLHCGRKGGREGGREGGKQKKTLGYFPLLQ